MRYSYLCSIFLKKQHLHRCNFWGMGVLFSALLLTVSGCEFFSAGPDERAPDIQVLIPGSGAHVGGEVQIFISAEARGGTENYVTSMAVMLNEERLGEADLILGGAEPIYVYRWDTSDYPSGTYRISAVAFDRFDGRGISTTNDVHLRNDSIAPGPEAAVVSHNAHDEVSGSISLVASPIEEGTPVTHMDFLIDGAVLTTVEGGPFIYEWDTSAYVLGMHLVQVRAYNGPDVFACSEVLELVVTDTPNVEEDNRSPGKPRFISSGFSGNVDGAVTVGFDNHFYFGSLDDTLYAYAPNGRPRWTYGTGGSIRTAPVIDNNENLYVVSDDQRLHGLGPDGQPLWASYPIGAYASMPTLGVAGDLYFGDTQGRVHRFDTFGGQSFSRWPKSIADAGIVVPPVIGEDGTVYVGSLDGHIYALSRDGGQIWRSADIGSVGVGMALFKDVQGTGTDQEEIDILYAVTSNGLYALMGENGLIRWHYPFRSEHTGPIRSAPVIGPDSTLYIGTSTGLVALNKTGNLKWRYTTPNVGTPVIDHRNQIYFASDRRLLSINANSTPAWSFLMQGSFTGPLTLRRDGLLLLATDNATLYGINTGSEGLALVQWPMFQRNARHTGRIGADATD